MAARKPFHGSLVWNLRRIGAASALAATLAVAACSPPTPSTAPTASQSLAEELIAAIGDPGDYPAEFRRTLAAELEGPEAAVGTKTIVAYRGGFDRDFSSPGDEEVADAARAWFAAQRPGERPRLTDDRLLRFGIWSGIQTGRPLQVHSGFGDPDLDLHRADPLLLTNFIRATEGQAPILLLHTYPFHRNAGYLAQMFPHVFLDVGLAINYAGVAAATIVAESLELAPFSKVLFSSDAWGAPELHLLGSWLWRRSMARTLGEWVARGDWSRDDAERVVLLVAGENARRVYELPDVPS